ncbi:MAG TPA: hypothetical protein VG650_08705 [Mycobacteriales bacterium]|nr:hypothetical protein [Mycobacteriales bacterium]
MDPLPGLAPADVDEAAAVVEQLWSATSSRLAVFRVPVLALRHRRLLTALSRALGQLPILRVQPSRSPAGQELTALLLGPHWRADSGRRLPELRVRIGGRLLRMPDRRAAVAVLELPADPAEYLAGRKKQALRTNLAHAREHGITVSEIVAGAEQLDCIEQVLVAREDEWWAKYESWLRRVVDARLVRLFAGRGPDGAVLTVALVVPDAPWAMLRLFVSTPDDLAGYARYSTHAFMVEALAKAGVRTLLVDTVFDAPPGVRYFQSRLGFELANIAVG